MAKLYGEIPASAKMTFDKSFARANGQPLDATEVFYSKASAETYAATDIAYIGQKIVVIESGIVTHYGIESDNSLKELGAAPVADGTTITITDDGKISLANITDEESSGTYNAVLVDGKLTWVKPSSTTVEGLSDLIAALTTRVDGLDEKVNGLYTNDAIDQMFTDASAEVDEKIAAVEAKIVQDTYPEWSEIAPAE